MKRKVTGFVMGILLLSSSVFQAGIRNTYSQELIRNIEEWSESEEVGTEAQTEGEMEQEEENASEAEERSSEEEEYFAEENDGSGKEADEREDAKIEDGETEDAETEDTEIEDTEIEEGLKEESTVLLETAEDQKTDMTSMENVDAEEAKGIYGQGMVSELETEEGGILFLNEQERDLVETDNPEDAELLEEIFSGEILAFASMPQIAEASAATAEASSGTEASAETAYASSGTAVSAATAYAASGTAAYRIVSHGVVEVDEVHKVEAFRELVYTDYNGKERSAPLYCMEASKEGLSNQDVKAEAVKALKNSTIRKLLYFGYGGPGDIADTYDPSCSHIRWERWQNRYIFTHMALTKVYSGQYGLSNEAEYEHAGVNKYLSKIESLTIPARDGIVFSANDGTGSQATGKNLVLNLRYFRSTPGAWTWVDTEKSGFTNGFQITYNIKVTDTAKAGNSIRIARSSSSVWQLGYWTSKAEMTERGQGNPHVLKVGQEVEMKSGYYFCMAFPKEMSSDQTYSFPMTLQPVSYLLVDGSVQSGRGDVQDFGVAVYQGEQGVASLKVHPYPLATLELTKTDFRNTSLVSGAKYRLYAAETIYEYTSKMHSKDAVVAEAVTDKNGKLVFSYIIPAKYYIKEVEPAPSYLLDPAKYDLTIKAGKNEISVKDIPELHGTVEIEKVDRETGEMLTGAEFTLYTWNSTTKKYASGVKLTYDAESKKYKSGLLSYDSLNLGKFRVTETKCPERYTGVFTQDFSIADLKPGETKLFSYRAENTHLGRPHIEVLKVDQETLEPLEGAEFVLYEWDAFENAYCEVGTLLEYDDRQERYVSGELEETDRNLGRYKIVETRNPSGYTGKWEMEVTIEELKENYQFTVQNERQKTGGYLRIHKIDQLSGKELEGAVFQVFMWDLEKKAYVEMEPATEFSYDKEASCYRSEELPVTVRNDGRFKVVETKNPFGYEGEWEREFQISHDGEEIELEAENMPVFGNIEIIKKIKETDITWAHGNPVFTFAAEGKDWNGKTHRYEESVVFYRDCYETDGNGYAIMQTVLRNIPLGSYQVYEKPVLRYYLASVSANTANVAVSVLGSPGYGRNPAEVAVGNVELSEDQTEASIVFINEKSRYDGYSHNSYVKNRIPISYEQAAFHD